MKFRGEAYRAVREDASSTAPPHPQAAGRWNTPASHSALYLALEQETALAELQKHARSVGIPYGAWPIKSDLAYLTVHFSRIVDLSDESVRRRYGLTIAQILSDDERDVETCRAVARQIFSEGYEGFVAPSAATRDGTGRTLNVFPENVSRDSHLAEYRREPVRPDLLPA